ncbi:MAG: hypothetical protein GWN87_29140 [Desulfuromonadales bacterium]|nr:hypothetical protein [Desulfuromonadales bacterium]
MARRRRAPETQNGAHAGAEAGSALPSIAAGMQLGEIPIVVGQQRQELPSLGMFR